MQLIKDTYYDSKPDDVTVYGSIVDVVVSVEPVNVEDQMAGESSVKWLCDVERYSTQEYIDVMHNVQERHSNELTMTQTAIADVFEMALSGGFGGVE